MKSLTAKIVKSLTVLSLTVLTLLLAPSLAAAQAFPAKPVRLIVPLPPGGSTDNLCRAIAAEISKLWGQPMIIENRPGANQIIGADLVAKSAPDGYTIFIGSRAPLVLSPLLYSKLPYDAAKDFAPVVNVANFASVLVVNAEMPVKSVKDLIAFARTRPPGALNYGSLGPGSNAHLDTEAFSVQAGIKMTQIPYKGLNEMMPAVMSNQIQLTISAVAVVAPLIRQGRVRALAVGTPQRSSYLPDVPTFAESGFPGIESQFWLGMLVPASTPRPIIDKLAADVGSVITQKAFVDRFLVAAGSELLNQGPDEFARVIEADRARYGPFVRQLNIKLD